MREWFCRASNVACRPNRESLLPFFGPKPLPASLLPRGGGSDAPGRWTGGRIVDVAARQALEPREGAKMSAYTAAKPGVAALSAALGEELAGEGILVNALAPSIMDTPTNRRDMPKANFDAWPKVEEVAATILFLASPRTS